jgi:NhaP-type Na+/H+ or K+/H+ antiporter
VTDTLVGLALVIVLGVAAQWLAWRVRLPSILFLLTTGFLAGPVLGWLDPNAVFGDLLLPVVSLSVAVILFEGGLSLDIAELKDIGRVVRNLVTVGALITWALATILASLLLRLQLELAVLFGAVLVVTGPTVVGPLLRHIRPRARVGSAVKWEGIVNDPIGAILSVLVFEAIVAGGFERGLVVTGRGILAAVLVGGGIGVVGASLVVVMLRRYWVPDFLQNPVALGVVVGTFAAADQLRPESGLLAVTVMGSALASQRFVSVRHIVAFKENLRVLLIAALFVVLAARLPLRSPDYLGPGSVAFLAALLLIVRPLAVAASTRGSKLDWRERVFIALMAPRGIVAAAVASVFAIDLVHAGYAEGARLVPLTFLVIVGTVLVYGIVAPIVARRLRIATPNPQGMLLIGAAPWVRDVAAVLQDSGIKTVLVDSNWANVQAARQRGLTVRYANVLTERALDQLELELDGIGRLLALTPNDEVNALASIHFAEFFDRSRMYQLSSESAEAQGKRGGIPEHLRGRLLFHADATHGALAARVQGGAVIKRTRLTEEFDYAAFTGQYGESALLLFTIRESGDVLVMTPSERAMPRPGQTLIALVDRPDEARS